MGRLTRIGALSSVLVVGLITVGCGDDDATLTDSGTDAASADGGGDDGGGVDAGTTDAGTTDSGVADAGTGDAGITVCNPAGDPFGGGAGTEAAPYMICSVAQLDRIRDTGNEDDAYVLTTDLDFDDLSSGFAPIPTFSGVFDGMGHSLFNLTFDDTDMTTGRELAFIHTLSGTLRNLLLVDVSINAHGSVASAVWETEDGESAVIENVVASGDISVTHGVAGGLVNTLRPGGTVDGGAFIGSILDSGSTGGSGGIVRSIGLGATARRVVFMGNLSSGGEKNGGIANALSGTLEQCFARVELTSTGAKSGGLVSVLAGADALLRDCYAMGNVVGGSATGGLIAEQWNGSAPLTPGQGQITRSYFAGSVSGTNSAVRGAGVPTLTDVFFDSDEAASTVGTGLSSLEMMDPDTAALDPLAGPTWVREEESYPRLAFEDGFFPEEAPCNVDGAPFGSGRGTDMRPYTLCTPAHLDAVRDAPTDIFILTTDIDLAGETFEPIPTFSGEFAGEGHVVRNWTAGGASEMNVAFILSLAGRVRDLGLEDVDLTASSAVAGMVLATEAGSHATLENVWVTGSITSGSGSAAGIVRSLRNSCRIVGAMFDGTITSAGGQFHGGIVQAILAGASVRRVVSRGSMVLTGGAQKAGGIASDLVGMLTEARSSMTITSESGTRVAGIAAVLGSGAVVRDCYATNAIDVGDSPTLVAGLFGETFGGGSRMIDRVFFAGTLTSGANVISGTGDGAVTFMDVFWDTDTTGSATAGPTGTTGHTTAELQMESTYPGWPSPPWIVDDGSYPSLDFEDMF